MVLELLEAGVSIAVLKRKIIPILNRYGVKKAGLFGSCIRGELREDSDIDILVELDSDLSLLDFIKIKLDLEDTLDRPVDLVEYSTIKPRLKDRILKEQMAILDH
jgi:predicted nucleotidyltransferase